MAIPELPPAAAEPPAEPRRRVPLWDNGRIIAILLVVVGHSIQRLTGLDAAYGLYLFIYAFHVPLFVLISGHFARANPTRRNLRRIITDLAIPYLVFETVWSVVKWLVEGDASFDLSTPSWTLWFVLALIAWRLVLPLFALVRWPLLWASAISVGAGYTTEIDSTLTLSRAFALLPFFVLGWQLREWSIGRRWRITPPRTVVLVRVVAGAIVLAAAVAAFSAVPLWRELKLKDFFFGDTPYVEIGYGEWWAGPVRLGLLTLSAVLALSVLALLPRHEHWFTKLGRGTMYVYLLHSFALYPLRESGILSANATPLVLAAMVLLAALITLVLSSRWIRPVFRPLIEPRLPRLFHPQRSVT